MNLHVTRSGTGRGCAGPGHPCGRTKSGSRARTLRATGYHRQTGACPGSQAAGGVEIRFFRYFLHLVGRVPFNILRPARVRIPRVQRSAVPSSSDTKRLRSSVRCSSRPLGKKNIFVRSRAHL